MNDAPRIRRTGGTTSPKIGLSRFVSTMENGCGLGILIARLPARWSRSRQGEATFADSRGNCRDVPSLRHASFCPSPASAKRRRRRRGTRHTIGTHVVDGDTGRQHCGDGKLERTEFCGGARVLGYRLGCQADGQRFATLCRGIGRRAIDSDHETDGWNGLHHSDCYVEQCGTGSGGDHRITAPQPATQFVFVFDTSAESIVKIPTRRHLTVQGRISDAIEFAVNGPGDTVSPTLSHRRLFKELFRRTATKARWFRIDPSSGRCRLDLRQPRL